ncbi:MAG: 3-hydroxybutyrate dehydrogenase [Rhizobiaceae bacterium]|nr:3-hydroxybutyrate dehydrogenase [Rhizobiaceae bacterium]MCV0407599.1 3-hydroxybutyrate dehydrogenase [Rhizobiaceae bacterium]
MSFSGKVAVVTGSTSGIGHAIAEALAGEGARVVINSFSDTEADRAIADRLAKAHGVEARYIPADMSKPEQCRALVERTAAEFGSIDILVNNAGIQHVSPIEDFPTDKWDAIIAINLSSNFHTTAAVIPGMKAKGWGRIVNIASAHGLRASPNKSAYVAAKHGVVGLTKTAALELAGSGVTANAVCPGFVLTPLVETQIQDRMKEHEGMDREELVRDVILEKQPSKQFATVEQIAGSVMFLCSAAADQITGTTISVDGGWTAA